MFQNVICCGGKRINFVVNNCENFSDAKNKAVKFIIKKYNLSEDDFKKELDVLHNNIENGETVVKSIPKKNIGGLDLSNCNKFDILYYGLLKEND